MFCVLCRFLLGRIDPDWLGKAESLHRKYLLNGLNNDEIFESETDPARLREIYALSQSQPSEAFRQFLPLAEHGSIWSMIQVGHAYEVGRGVTADRGLAEHWYTEAYEGGSDYGLLRASVLAARRGDRNAAKRMLEEGTARGVARAMSYLAWLELKFRGKQGRDRARDLYERAVSLGDFDARVSLARAMARGRFGLAMIPEGFRRIQAIEEDFSARVNAQSPEVRSASN